MAVRMGLIRTAAWLEAEINLSYQRLNTCGSNYRTGFFGLDGEGQCLLIFYYWYFIASITTAPAKFK